MAQGHFLIRNRHQQMWYGRVVIPRHLRTQFNQRSELRVSLKTPDKQQALRRSRHFWLQCQSGFERLYARPRQEPFENTRAFIHWLARDNQGHRQTDMAYYIETFDVFGKKHVIDLDDPAKEQELAMALQANALALLDRYKDNPDILDRLMKIGHAEFSASTNQPESPTTFHDAVALYIDKLESQGRKGKKLAPRTILHYKDKLSFWQRYFGHRAMHTLTLKELGEIQNWLPSLPSNFMKKAISVDHAVKMAQNKSTRYPAISDKTRAEYLGQLKGLLEYAHSNGFIASQMASHIEMPNTTQSKTIERLPFSNEDLQKIFPGRDYGIDFGIQRTGLDRDSKFWFPLLAAFSGARLEELGQLQTEDIRTCPDTGIVYAMIDNKGAAADGVKKHTKNLNSVRPIPIHSTLIKIGFLDYVAQRQKDKKDSSLFKLKRDNQGRLAKTVSNWFSRVDQRKDGNLILGYIERRGVESKGQSNAGERWSKSFHSFRHTVIDNLRGKQLANGEYIREPDIGLVVGHERDKLETASYGQDRMQLSLRKAVIEAIGYKDIVFSEIYWKC
tara:strand:+ start:7675 stop:9351 length:1677 start_codon:yes stop_codon:yes gene_type:complete